MAAILVAGTGEPAFVSRLDGTIAAWNRAAAELLPIENDGSVEALCFDVLCGEDASGNRYCDRHCSLTNMARRSEPPRAFQLSVKTASGARTSHWLTSVVVSLPDCGKEEVFILHVLSRTAPGDSSADPSQIERQSPIPGSPATPKLPPLSSREMEVLNLLAEGTSTEEIGTTLFISVATVRSHVQSILGKLDAHSKLEAVATAYRVGLISP